jgi:biopolymer transport protein ExbD
MRLPNYSQVDRGRLDVKMTPMIDVVFQLLIFFVCTVSFQAIEEILPTHLRAPGGSGPVKVDPELAELEDVVIRVTHAEGRTEWLLSGRLCKQLAEVRGVLIQLVQLNARLPVIIDSGPDVPLGDVIDVYDLCRLTGFQKIHFAAHAKM